MAHLASRMARLKELNANSDDGHSKEGNTESQYYLKGILNSHSIIMLAILEPKINGDRISNIARFLGFSNFMEGADINNHVWLFWKDDVVVSHPIWDKQFLTVEVHNLNDGESMACTFIYASCDKNERQSLFDDLVEYSESISGPWIIAGDFNVISKWDEKRGGNLDDDGSMDAINQFHMDACVSDVGFKGNPFTWSNNHRGETRVWERLDHVICNDQAFCKFPHMQVQHLARVKSDHCPLLIDLEVKERKGFFFHYLKIWEDHPGFYDVVEECLVWDFSS
ncbi:hypothetical protein QQ045_020453 [Rhodiola kirilowii]